MQRINCPHCGKTLKFEAIECKDCGFRIRDRIPGIELWRTLYLITFDYKTAIVKVIYSEQKNYSFFIQIVIAFYISTNILIYGNIFDKVKSLSEFAGIYFLLAVLILLIMHLLIFILTKIISKKKKEKISFKQVLSIFTYSFSPMIIIFPVILFSKLALFSYYNFSSNPSSFDVKPIQFILIYFIEYFMIGWLLYNNRKGFLFYLNEKFIPNLFTIFLTISILCIIFYSDGIINSIITNLRLI